MGSSNPKVSLDMGNAGLVFSMSENGKTISVEMPLEACASLLRDMGQKMNAKLFEAIGSIESPATTSNVIPAKYLQSAVNTYEGKNYLTIQFENFPALRIEIPERALKSAGNALLEISDTPKDIRDQRTN